MNKRFLQWSVYNTFWYLMGALGAIVGIGWAFNIFAFLTWLCFFVVILLSWYKSFCKRTGTAYEGLGSLPIPMWLDFSFDLVFALMLAATGHWFYAAMVIVNEVIFIDILKENKPAPTVPS